MLPSTTKHRAQLGCFTPVVGGYFAMSTSDLFLRQGENSCFSPAHGLAVFRINMQDISNIFTNRGYDPHMAGGRPAIKKPTVFGARLASARKSAGLTQSELAKCVGVTQRVVAYWERESVGLKSEQLIALSEALKVTTDQLLGLNTKQPRKGGVTGRAKRLFDEVQSLSKSKQRRILDTIETLLAGEAVRS